MIHFIQQLTTNNYQQIIIHTPPPASRLLPVIGMSRFFIIRGIRVNIRDSSSTLLTLINSQKKRPVSGLFSFQVDLSCQS